MHGWMESKNGGNLFQINLILFASQRRNKYGGWNVCGLIARIDRLYLEGHTQRIRLQDLKKSNDCSNITFPSVFWITHFLNATKSFECEPHF